MILHVDTDRVVGRRDPLIYGHFIEHFHRQIYGGIYDPGSPLADEEGFRTDVIAALRKIKAPVLRWPGGCFVSAHHWKNAVGPARTPVFDKAWRVEEPNSFGTDEYIAFCRKAGVAPYICTNAGTGSAEEMSDWVEYCNLKDWGPWAKLRAANGHPAPYGVKYWSIGNENYGGHEIGAKSAGAWARLVTEAAKMMKRVDPSIELSAAALADIDWNARLLRSCGERLDWLSLHDYWDAIHQNNDYATYEQCMAYTNSLSGQVDKVRGLLTALGLEKKIRLAFDEWNLRGWYHPNVVGGKLNASPEEYLTPRDLNDDNTRYTMADAVFAACFLNMALRNCDIVGMANYAPVVNTRGCIFTHKNGVVLRSTYHVFDLYVNGLGDTVLDTFSVDNPSLVVRDKWGRTVETPALDVVAALDAGGVLSVAAVNKDPVNSHTLRFAPGSFSPSPPARCAIRTLAGTDTESYNDIGHDGAVPAGAVIPWDNGKGLDLPPHSVTVARFSREGPEEA